MADIFDLAIIGGGPAGYVAALRASQLMARIALLEKDKVGGTCLNVGCIPTKALIRSAEALLEAKNAGELGVDIAGSAVPNWPRMMARKNHVVATLVSGIENLLAGGKVSVFRSAGQLRGQTDGTWLIAAGEETVQARRVLVATGSVPARLPVPGMTCPVS